MSLRTKILAAVVGLNLLVLLLGVALLVSGRPREPSVPAELVALVSGVVREPKPTVESRFRALARLWEKGPGVLALVLVEENGDKARGPLRKPLAVAVPSVPAPSEADAARAAELFITARQRGRAQVHAAEGEWAQVLDGGAEPPAEGAEPYYQGLYVRWSPAREQGGAPRTLWLVLAGVALVTVVAWALLSRLVVRPLKDLAAAADRMAGGDVAARVAASGQGDEIDRTAQAFNRMAREVGEQQGQLESRVMEALDRIKKAERHLVIAQRLAATGKLASGIAHEINNPLGGLRNAVRALARGDLEPAKTAEYLSLVQDGLARLEDTVKKVLAFTPRSVKPRRTDLADVARKAIALARHRLERKGIELVEAIPEDGRVWVFGDPHELQQVALNLILNAADAIPERASGGQGLGAGPGRVEVEVREDGESVLLRVTDDGIGMSPEVQAQAFDLFFTTKEVGEGTGLGLAIVHNIVTNHGGRIEVESAPGQGATFRVVLPREGQSESERTPSREPPAVRSPEPRVP
jgi:signal transduction histidine kinase